MVEQILAREPIPILYMPDLFHTNPDKFHLYRV
nr:MAG TPA: hypothetical protein [Caudoviricetes sp.]